MSTAEQKHFPRLLIVIPAYNEGANLHKVLESINRSGFSNVVVVDDGSTDNTLAVAFQHNAVALSLTSRLGAWGATQTGIRYGVEHGYDLIITMDADGQHSPLSIPLLLEKMERTNADVVIGSCYDRGSTARKTAWHLFRKISGVPLKDLTSGLKAYNRRASSLLTQADAAIFDYQDLGVILYLQANSIRIVEQEIVISHRVDGKSRIFASWVLVIRYMLQTIIICLSMRTFRTNPATYNK